MRSALNRLQTEAISLGFIPADSEDIEFVIVADYPAEAADFSLLEQLPTAVTQPPPPETMAEAIWLSLRGRVSGFVQGGANE